MASTPPSSAEAVTSADPATVVSSPVAGDESVKASKPNKAAGKKKLTQSDAAREMRRLHWPLVKEEQLWLLNGERGGFAQVPRTLSLISEVVIKQAVKKKTGVSSAAGSTYNVLWLRTQGEGISKIDNEADSALEAGYGGERGISTFRKHIRVLKDLGFIDFVEESRGRVKWVLMLNPYQVVKKLYDDGFVDKCHYAAVRERAQAIGSSGELKGNDDAVE